MEDSLTKDMRIDILSGIKEKYLTEALPILKKINGIYNFYTANDTGLETNKVIAYIVILYSQDSILNQEPMPSLEERQLKSADLAGFKRTASGEHLKKMTDILFPLDNDGLQKMVLDFLIFQNNMLWDEIVIDEQYRYTLMKEMLSESNDSKSKDRTATLEKKSKLRDEITKIRLALDERYKEMFRDAAELITVARQELAMTTLESLAE